MSVTDKGLMLLLVSQLYVLYKVIYLERQQMRVKKMQVVLLHEIFPSEVLKAVKGAE